jgi:hypothetical protein
MRIEHYLSFVALIILSGCAASLNEHVNEHVRFEDSNAYFLNANMHSLDITEISEQIDINDKVAVFSIEVLRTHDGRMIAAVEDVLIEKLLEHSVKVVERDDDLLYRLMAEEDDYYTYLYRSKKAEDFAALNTSSSGGSYSSFGSMSGGISEGVGPEALTGAITGREISGGWTAKSSGGSARFVTQERFSERVETSLATADKLLVYRVLECGIMYESRDNSSPTQRPRGTRFISNPDSVKRIANFVFNYRLIDAKTGLILDFGDLSTTTSDWISETSREQLENYHYTNYGYQYPNTYGNHYQMEVAAEVIEEDRGEVNWKVLGGVAGGLLLLVVLL